MGIFGITRKAFGRTIVFTLVEVVALSVWLDLSNRFGIYGIVTLIVLFVTLFVEHLIAVGTTKN